jgi:hypothetical protein
MSLFDEEARTKISTLDEQVSQQERRITALEGKLLRVNQVCNEFISMKTALSRVPTEVQGLFERVEAISTRIASEPTSPSSPLSPSALVRPSAPSSFPLLDSKIITDFPSIFSDFNKREFLLLYRGSRDGSTAEAFHSRCDGHTNTLTVILDTGGNVFGGFTPLSWESRDWNGKQDLENNIRKCDESQKSFLFTLKNPHNVIARTFRLKSDRKQFAILCDRPDGPIFGYGSPDLCVFSASGGQSSNATTGFGTSYVNDTGLPGRTFFTGSEKFDVREIEVFEVKD